MKRKVLALVALLVLVAGAGCLTGGPSQEDLNRNATYDWNTTTNVSITLIDGGYQSIYTVSNRTELEVYGRDTFGQREALSTLSSLQFQYPDGRTVNASAFNVSSDRDGTTLELPGEDGKVAFTVERNGKELRTPVFVDGASYTVLLPEGTGVGIPILAHVVPGDYNVTTDDGRPRLTWSNVESDDLLVQYYLERDLLIFGGFFLIAFAAALGGGLYYWRQIRGLEKRRDEVALDVDDEDDDPRDRGPPPGMK